MAVVEGRQILPSPLPGEGIQVYFRTTAQFGYTAALPTKGRGRVPASRRRSNETNEETETGKTAKRHKIKIFDTEIPIFIGRKIPYEHFSESSDSKEFKIPIDILPSIFISTDEYRELVITKKKRTSKEALEIGKQELWNKIENTLPDGCEILEKNEVHSLTEKNEVEITAEIVCRENIAVSSPFETDLTD